MPSAVGWYMCGLYKSQRCEFNSQMSYFSVSGNPVIVFLKQEAHQLVGPPRDKNSTQSRRRLLASSAVFPNFDQCRMEVAVDVIFGIGVE